MTVNQAPIVPLTDDLSGLNLAELLAEADRIGGKYQSPEERSLFQAALTEVDAEIEDLLSE